MTEKINDAWVDRFIDEALPIIQKALDPEQVIIFGSRVVGTSAEESDIDVLIVSDAFRDEPFLGRMPKLLRLLRFPWPIDFLCYSPDEFEEIKTQSIIVKQAVKEGLRAA